MKTLKSTIRKRNVFNQRETNWSDRKYAFSFLYFLIYSTAKCLIVLNNELSICFHLGTIFDSIYYWVENKVTWLTIQCPVIQWREDKFCSCIPYWIYLHKIIQFKCFLTNQTLIHRRVDAVDTEHCPLIMFSTKSSEI